MPDAFILGEKFINRNNVALILGDNFFYGQYLSQKLKSCVKLKSGAKILLHKVAKPEAYGVAKIDKKNKVIGIKEKPKNFFSDGRPKYMALAPVAIISESLVYSEVPINLNGVFLRLTSLM